MNVILYIYYMEVNLVKFIGVLLGLLCVILFVYDIFFSGLELVWKGGLLFEIW